VRKSRAAFADVEREVGGHVASDEQTHITADAGVDSDVLLAVRGRIGDGVADDTGADLELPEQLARAGVRRLEPTVERAVEDDIAGGDEGAAPDRKGLPNSPHFPAIGRVPGDELAPVVTRTSGLGRVGADVRRARDVAHRA